MKEKKKSKVKSTKSKGSISKIAHSYADKPTKGNLKNTGIKTGAEVVSLVTGAALSAGLGGFGNGYVSIGTGIVAIIAGNYFGDPTKLTSVLGASMIGYGIGKINEHKALSKSPDLKGLDGAKSKLGEGFSRFASEIMSVVGIEKKDSADELDDQTKDESIGSIDVSILDQFEQINELEAIRFDEQQQEIEDEKEIESAFLDEQDEQEQEDFEQQEEFAFAQFEDADLTNI